MDVLRVYDQNESYKGLYLTEEEEMCKKFCEIHGYYYKRERLFEFYLTKYR